jgi:hypothetical protein
LEEGETEQATLEIQVAYGEAEAQRQKLHQEVKSLEKKTPPGDLCFMRSEGIEPPVNSEIFHFNIDSS